jgi:hypothetical protein
MLEVCWDGLWTLSFGLSQFHGHGSWLVCEVALMCRADVNTSVQGFRVCRSSGSLSRNSSVRGCHKNPIQSNLSFYTSKNVREATQIDECPRPMEWYEEEKWLILWKSGLILSDSPCNEPHSYQDNHDKVDVPNSNTTIIWRPIFDSYTLTSLIPLLLLYLEILGIVLSDFKYSYVLSCSPPPHTLTCVLPYCHTMH